MRIRTAFIAVLAIILPTLSPVSAQAGPTRAGVRLVWSQFVDFDFSAIKIVIADVDGGEPRPLTDPAAGVQDIDPQISPDGRLVAFERQLPDTSQVVLVGSDGTGERVVDLHCTDPCAGVSAPTWTPDGEHLMVDGPFDAVNDSARSAAIWRADLRGGMPVRLSEVGIDGAFEDYRATVAPAGYVVFMRTRNADIRSAAFRMEAGAGCAG